MCPNRDFEGVYILRHNWLLIAFDCIRGNDLAYRHQWRMDCNDTRLSAQIDGLSEFCLLYMEGMAGTTGL